jgi:acylphosphatase
MSVSGMSNHTMSNHMISRVIIRGDVQGVGYRAFVEHEAGRHHLRGWVRNRRDGSVEAVFAGRQDAVEAMIEACRRGPAAARVSTLDRRQGTDADLLTVLDGETFSVLPTA